MEIKVSRLMNQYYTGVRYGATSDSRKGYRTKDLLSADKKAVSAAIKDLRKYDYKAEKEDGDKTLSYKVQAFAETYNNYLDSADAMNDSSVSSYKSKIKKLTKEQTDLLSDIGVTIQSNGKLKVDTDKLEKASNYKISKVFGEDTEYGADLEQLMKRLDNMVRRNGIGQSSTTSSSASVAAAGTVADEPDDDPDADGTTDTSDSQSADSQLYQALAESLNAGTVNYSI